MWAKLTLSEFKKYVDGRATVVYALVDDKYWSVKPGPKVVAVVTTGQFTTVVVPGSALYAGPLRWFRHTKSNRKAFLLAVDDAVAAVGRVVDVNVLAHYTIQWGRAAAGPAGVDANLTAWPWSEHLAALMVDAVTGKVAVDKARDTITQKAVAPSLKDFVAALIPARRVVVWGPLTKRGAAPISIIKPVWTATLSRIIAKAIQWDVVLTLPHRIDIRDSSMVKWRKLAAVKVDETLALLPAYLPPTLRVKVNKPEPSRQFGSGIVADIVAFCVRSGIVCGGDTKAKANERAAHMAAVIKRQLKNNRPFMGPPCIDQRRETGEGCLKCRVKRTPNALRNACGVVDNSTTPSDVFIQRAKLNKMAPPCVRHGHGTSSYQRRFETAVMATIAYDACVEQSRRTEPPPAKRSRIHPN